MQCQSFAVENSADVVTLLSGFDFQLEQSKMKRQYLKHWFKFASFVNVLTAHLVLG